ncbi:MAG: hypothetical protein IKM88_07570, partial [Lachnospiraceae bacterium]|nr:hypothetical protein [Lachnospiraceae bacterium]
RDELAALTPGKYHWRGWLPRTYYLTHTLGPLMHVTGQTPVKVNAFAVHSQVQEQYEFRHNCVLHNTLPPFLIFCMTIFYPNLCHR